MKRAFGSSTSCARKAARIPSLQKFVRAGALLATVIVLAFSFAACSSSNSSILTSITVTPATASIAVGGTQQYVATGTFSNGGTQVITNTVTWTSGTTTTATISTGGLATGVAAGTSIITASFAGNSLTITGTALLNVTVPVTLTSIAVTPATAEIPVGSTQQYTATGTFSDGSTQDLTSTATWASSTTTVATISSPGGLATAVAAGTTTITAACGTVTSPGVTLTVGTLNSIAVTPANASIAVGATEQYTATGTFSDGNTIVLTNATWTSSSTSVATISTTGLATGVAAGTTTITATSGTVSGSTTLTVTGSGGANDALLTGQYALLLTGSDVNLVDYAAVASITADGLGNITTGEIDFADACFLVSNDPVITGTYTIGSDGRGTITLNTGDPIFGVGGVTTISVSMTSNLGGLIIEADTFATGSGSIAMQGTGSTSQSSITGPYDFAFSGQEDQSLDGVLAAGTFTADGAGNFTNGVQDVVTAGSPNLDGPISGTYGAPDSNGRGTATLLSGGYAYYSVGGTTLFFIENDANNLLAGSVVTQASSPSLPAGSYAFAGGGTDYLDGGLALAVGGLFTSDGSINITSGTLDFNDGGSGTSFSNIPISGSWTVGTNGRGVMTLSDPGYPITEFSFYPTANNGIFMLEIDGSGFQSGEVAMAQSGTFSSASLTGPYATNFSGVNSSSLEHDVVGELTSDGVSVLTGLADVNVFNPGSNGVTLGGAFTGTYTVSDTTGRFPGLLTDSESSQTVEFYAAGGSSPNTALFISLDMYQVNSGVMESQLFTSIPPQAGHASWVLPAHFIEPRVPLHGTHTNVPRVPVK